MIALIVLGNWLEVRAKCSTGAAIQALIALGPDRARAERDGGEIKLRVGAASRSDVVVVRLPDAPCKRTSLKLRTLTTAGLDRDAAAYRELLDDGVGICAPTS